MSWRRFVPSFRNHTMEMFLGLGFAAYTLAWIAVAHTGDDQVPADDDAVAAAGAATSKQVDVDIDIDLDAVDRAEPLPAAVVSDTTDQVKLDAELAHPMVLAGSDHRAYLKVGLTGFTPEADAARPPLNVSFVIDRSGSMSGANLDEAKRATIAGIERLQSDDVVSVVTYDSVVTVVVPPTRVRARESIIETVSGIGPGGNTALFAGVARGAAELRRFSDDNQVNRIILLSDGQANVGPSSPDELGALGRSLAQEGVSISTIGLGYGYNEQLMVQLAQGGAGYHYFVQDGTQLASIFEAELGQAASVVAQDVTVTVDLSRGVELVRAHGREARREGQRVTVDLNQLYAGFSNYFLLELDVPPTVEDDTRLVAEVGVTYRNMITRTDDRLTAAVSQQGTASQAVVDRHENPMVMATLIEFQSVANYQLALVARTEGRYADARNILQGNQSFIDDNINRYGTEQLKALGSINEDASDNFDDPAMDKEMSRRSYMIDELNAY